MAGVWVGETAAPQQVVGATGEGDDLGWMDILAEL
jgi:hypothetical protein